MLPVASFPFCSTTPSWRRTALISSVSIAFPSRNTVPDSGFSKPSSKRSTEDFPLPDGPTMATYSPCAILRETFSGTGGPLVVCRKVAGAGNKGRERVDARGGEQRFPDPRTPQADRCHRLSECGEKGEQPAHIQQ